MSNNSQHTADSKSMLPSEAAQQRARVLMSIDPKIFALQQKNGFADGIILGNEVTLSGVVTEFGNGETDLETAYIRTFETIGKILERAGSSWDEVIEIHSFHTDLNAQLPAFVAAKKHFVKLPHRAWTAIGIAELVGGNSITETRIRARIGITLSEG
jgi:enamine deaminase RidA (YjgF/YER057c/UK114 family)